jgi:hypothetical protein
MLLRCAHVKEQRRCFVYVCAVLDFLEPEIDVRNLVWKAGSHFKINIASCPRRLET